MAANSENAERRVVPRWRKFHDALATGELSSAAVKKESKAIQGAEFVKEREQSWKENRSLPFAVDLVTAATVLGSSPIAAEAAEFILENEGSTSNVAGALARKLLGIPDAKPDVEQPDSRIHVISGIKTLKARRIQQPRNAFVWVDLARLYVTLGQGEAARQALRIARALAPTERFVLRSTTRFLLHMKEAEEALQLLRANPRTPADPWLVAAEIAVSSVVKKPSKFAKLGQAILANFESEPLHKSELAGALATMEMEHGKQKQANRLFNKSLEQPTDNALAQVVWASKRAGLGQVSAELLSIPHASEALTFDAFNCGKWKELVIEAREWMRDESFSARPRLLASSVATSLLQDAELGEQIARAGLFTNPRHPALVNNVAFAIINQRKPKAALELLESANTDGMTPSQAVCLLATKGLANYRLGNKAKGRELYEQAIKAAEIHGLEPLRVVATMYLARERLLSGDSDAILQFRRAYEEARKSPFPYITALADRLLRDLEESKNAEAFDHQ